MCCRMTTARITRSECRKRPGVRLVLSRACFGLEVFRYLGSLNLISSMKARLSMHLLRFKQAATMVTTLLLLTAASAQELGGDKVDPDVLNQIKTEAYHHSQVMENLYYMSEVYGPRVNNSRNHRAAAEWAMQQMKAWGMQNVHLEKWGPFGYGWQIKKFYGALETPAYASLIGFPLAWTPGTNGPVTADAVLAPLHSKEDFAKYKGKLKGKIVLIFDPRELKLHTEPESRRLTDEDIQARANGGGFGG